MLHLDRGMLAGNSYLTSARMEHPFQIQCGKEGFCLYSGEDGAFGGLHTGLKLYPSGSVYEDQAWAVSILMPEKALDDAIQGNSRYLLLIALVLLAVSLLLSIFISRRYLRPVTEALDRIKARDYAGPGKTPYLEINDLMEFLTQQDEELKKRSLAIAPPPDETAPMFEQFLQNVKTLSQAERNVFDLYIRGYKAQEIADELHLSINTCLLYTSRCV